jgi:hypothetical protein
VDSSHERVGIYYHDQDFQRCADGSGASGNWRDRATMSGNASGAELAPESELPVRDGRQASNKMKCTRAYVFSDNQGVQLPKDLNHPAVPQGGEANEQAQGQTVRFSSQLQEIEPEHSLHPVETLTQGTQRTEALSVEAQQELRELSKSIQQKSQLQTERMRNFAFEPVSLPASRVCLPTRRYPSVSAD